MSEATEASNTSVEVQPPAPEAPTGAPTGAPAELKRERTELQKKALEAARQKALALRAERKLQKSLPAEKAEVVPEVIPTTPAAEPGVEYVRKAKKPPKKKRIIVVQESSSSEEEVEIRLPKKRSTKFEAEPNARREPDGRDDKFEASMEKLFSIY
jgi:hypothetical protein